MPDLTIKDIDQETVDALQGIAKERDATVDELVLGLIDREVRNRKGRSVASLVVLFGPIVVLVLLILFGD